MREHCCLKRFADVPLLHVTSKGTEALEGGWPPQITGKRKLCLQWGPPTVRHHPPTPFLEAGGQDILALYLLGLGISKVHPWGKRYPSQSYLALPNSSPAWEASGLLFLRVS